MLRFAFSISLFLSVFAISPSAPAQAPAVAEPAGDSNRLAEPGSRQGMKSPAVAQTETHAPAGDGKLRFSFFGAQWDRVFGWLAEEAGLTLDQTDTPPGTFYYVNDKEHTIPEAIDAVNGYLLPRGYVVLRRDKFLVVLKSDNPILPNLIPTVSKGELANYGDNELLRILVPVPGYKPSEIAEQVM